MHVERMPQPRLRRGMTLKSKTQPHLRCGMMLYISLPLQVLFMPWVTSDKYKWVTLAERRSFDEGLQRLYMEFSKGQHESWQAVQANLKGREFFRPGPLMRALECDRPCVLLIDELDKVDDGFEAMLLEILSAWQLSIPEFGTVEAKSIPFVVLTSNEERRLGDPIRRRSLYVRVEHPSPAREAEIIASRTPDADDRFHREMAGIALSFRNYSLEKPPSVSEMIDFASALRLLGADHVTEDLRDVLLPFLAKTEKDRRHLLLREGFKSLLDDGARFAARLTVPEATE